jgi:hypothetical protein
MRGLLAVCLLMAARELRAADSYYLFVFSNPAAGKEAEYNRWYDDEHAPDVVSVPGFVSAQRFALAVNQLRAGSPPLPKYLVLYKIASADLRATYAEVNRRAGNGQTRMSNSVDPTSFANRTYRVIRPAVKGNDKLTGKAAAGTRKAYYQFVFGTATARQDQAFNEWYDASHLPDVLSVPGFVWGVRSQLSDVQLNKDGSGTPWLAMFRIETADLAATFAEFGTRAPKMTMSQSFDGDRTFGYTYETLGPELNGDKIRAIRASAAK